MAGRICSATGQHRTGASGESSEGPERSGGRAQEIGIQPDGTKAYGDLQRVALLIRRLNSQAPLGDVG